MINNGNDEITMGMVFIFMYSIIFVLIYKIKVNINKNRISKINIYNNLDKSKLLLDTLNKKIKTATQYNIEINEHLELAIIVENEIEKLRSNISNIFTENELITNGKDVQKYCDIVDEHNEKISEAISKLNNVLADKILK